MNTRFRFSGARVRLERKRRRLSLEQLAELIGVTPPFLGQIELGKRKPSLETFERLLAVFKASPETLMQPAGPQDEVPLEERIAAILGAQPKDRQEIILRSLRLILKGLPPTGGAAPPS